MSEYQYYEFLAVDRVLSSKEIEAIREFSSRAEITATHFQNEYNWGDFRGDVEDFLASFYDLHLYYANWGTHTFGISFPIRAVDAASLKPYFPKNSAAECSTRDQRFILIFTSTAEGGDWDGLEEVTMGELAPLRDEILAGDLRPLYLGWLAGIFDESAYLDDDAEEPPVPAGLQNLTPAQQAFANFMRIDADLLAIAAQSSPPLAQAKPDPSPWLRSLPSSEKDAFLVAVMEGRAGEVAAELRARFRRTLPRSEVVRTARKAGELRAAAETATAEREQREAEAKARRRAADEAKAAIARAKYLDEIAPTRARLWQQVDQLIATRLPKNYDECVKTLRNLRDVAHRHKHVAEYDQRMTALHEHHRAKTSLQDRFRKAGLV